MDLINEDSKESHRSVFSLSSVCAQFSSASRARVSGHGTSWKGAIYLCVGLLHRPDRVHPEGHAHTWHCLSRLRPRRTGNLALLLPNQAGMRHYKVKRSNFKNGLSSHNQDKSPIKE